MTFLLEIFRENGLEVLYRAFERCTSVLSHSSKPDDLAVTVCVHLTRFYSVASQFQKCREKMVEMPELVKNICRIFYYKVSHWRRDKNLLKFGKRRMAFAKIASLGKSGGKKA